MTRLKLADMFTFLSILAGVLAVAFVLMGEVHWAGIALIFAVAADSLDGTVAKQLKQANTFGKYIDSLADICSFGFAPAVIAFVVAGVTPILFVAATTFIFAGVYRLARYQISTPKGGFEGMPITLNGILFALLILFAPSYWFSWLFPAYFFLAAVLMVSRMQVRRV